MCSLYVMTFTDCSASIQCSELHYPCIACISPVYNLSAETHLAISLHAGLTSSVLPGECHLTRTAFS